MNTERDPRVEDVELRAALCEHFTSEVEEIGRTSAPPETTVEAVNKRRSPSSRGKWVLLAAAAVLVTLGTVAWFHSRTELPRARTLRAIERYLAAADARVILELEAASPFLKHNLPSPRTTYIVQWDSESRYRIGRRNESGARASSGSAFDVIPPVAGFDGTSSWYFSGLVVNIADGDVTGEGDATDVARFIATGLLRQVRDDPESTLFDEGEAMSVATRVFMLCPRDPGGQRGAIQWEQCTLTVDAESEAILRGSARLRVGLIAVAADFEVRGWEEAVEPAAFATGCIVPPPTLVEPVDGPTFKEARARMTSFAILDDHMIEWLIQAGYLAGGKTRFLRELAYPSQGKASHSDR